MKNLKFLVVALVMMFGVSVQNTNAQLGEVAAVLSGAAALIEAVDDACDSNRPEGGYMVCKGGECVSGKCISLRSRCDGECGEGGN